MNIKKISGHSPGQYKIESTIHKDDDNRENHDRLIILLHGYCEKGETIFSRLYDYLPSTAKVIAPNGLYPLPKGFPLGTRTKDDDLLLGFAWYFYDPIKDEYLIDYKYPAEVLSHYIDEMNPKKLPVTIIGYSQGGYLAPFIAINNTSVDHIIGINCSFRHQLFPRDLKIKVDAINGGCDIIVDAIQAKKRHHEILEKGATGSFILLKQEKHKLSKSFKEEVQKLLKF